MSRPHDYRIDPFTGGDQSLLYERWPFTIPSSSPYYVYLPELPREEAPSSMVIQTVGATSNIQPDAAAGIDTYLDEANPTTNYGTTAYMRAGTAAGGQKARAYAKFDISSGPTVAERVVVRLYLETAGGSAQTFGIHKLTSAPTEATDTWNVAPSHDAVAEATTSVNGAGWYEWDITDLYNAWKAGSTTNHGVMIKHANEATADTQRQFTSSDGSASQRPTLRIVAQGTLYSEVGVSIEPATMEAGVNYDVGVLRFNSAQAGQNGLATFYGTGSPVAAHDVGALSRYLGSGANGELNVLTGTTTLAPGLYSYTSIYIAPGATLECSGPGPLIIGCTGDCDIFGSINLNGKGYAGGAGGAAGQAGAPGAGFGHIGGRGGQPSRPAITVTNDPTTPAELGALQQALISYMTVGTNPFDITAANAELNVYWNQQLEFGTGTAALVTYLTTGTPRVGAPNPGTGGFAIGNSGAQTTALTSYLTTAYGTGSQYGGVLALAAYLAGAYDSSTGAQTATPVGGGGGGGSLNAGTNGTDGSGNVSGAGGEKHVVTSDGIEEFMRLLPGGGGGGGGGDASTGGTGGAGGGALLLQVEGVLTVDANATITATGSAGGSTGSGNGGGGGGGAIHIRCNRRTMNGVTPTVTGGAGHGRGGAGSAGWQLVEDLEPAS